MPFIILLFSHKESKYFEVYYYQIIEQKCMTSAPESKHKVVLFENDCSFSAENLQALLYSL